MARLFRNGRKITMGGPPDAGMKALRHISAGYALNMQNSIVFDKKNTQYSVMQKRNVSTVLRALLDQHGISPTELHRRTGVPQSTPVSYTHLTLPTILLV